MSVFGKSAFTRYSSAKWLTFFMLAITLACVGAFPFLADAMAQRRRDSLRDEPVDQRQVPNYQQSTNQALASPALAYVQSDSGYPQRPRQASQGNNSPANNFASGATYSAPQQVTQNSQPNVNRNAPRSRRNPQGPVAELNRNSGPNRLPNVRNPLNSASIREITVQVPRTVTQYVQDSNGSMRPVTTTVYETQRRQVATVSAGDLRLNMEISQLAAKLQAAFPKGEIPESDIAPLLDKLGQQFDARHEQQTERISKLMEDIARVKETLEQRQSERDQIIDRRAKQLLGQHDPLNWDYAPSLPNNSAPPGRYGGVLPDQNIVSGDYYERGVQLPPTQTYQAPGPGSNDEFMPPQQFGPNTVLSAPNTIAELPPSDNFSEALLPPESAIEEQPTQMEPVQEAAAPTSDAFPLTEWRQLGLRTPDSLLRQATTDLISGSATDDPQQPAMKQLVEEGYSLKQLLIENKDIRRLASRGVVSRGELMENEIALEKARTIWSFRQAELRDAERRLATMLDLAQSELGSAERLLSVANDAFNAGTTSERERIGAEQAVLKSKNQLLLREQSLQAIQQRINWLKKFQDSLAADFPGDDSEATASSELPGADVEEESSLEEDFASEDVLEGEDFDSTEESGSESQFDVIEEAGGPLPR